MQKAITQLKPELHRWYRGEERGWMKLQKSDSNYITEKGKRVIFRQEKKTHV